MEITITIRGSKPYTASRLVDEITYLMNTFKVKGEVKVTTTDGTVEEEVKI